ncbi:MAG: FkbM family methyltransferase [Chthoniobacterales bacterium]|nr:FkbM family methyltransferase [Chthoniobacterales bacterium]
MTMLQSASGLLKPCYLFSPATLLRRVFLHVGTPASGSAEVDLPWGASIQVNLDDQIGSEIFKQRIFDLALSECAWRILAPGDHVIDAGANIGYMTMLFAAKTGSSGVVHAFEPHPTVGATLERNVQRMAEDGRGGRVITHRQALGATSGVAQLFESDYFAINQGTASMANVPSEGESSTSHWVEVETLDDLFPTESFALLKIDVEGFETEVLTGAEGLLKSRRITHVIYEDHRAGGSGLNEMLTKNGYAVFAIGYGALGPKLLPTASAEDAIDTSWESASFLATLDPVRVNQVMRSKGWHVLRGA